MLDEKILEEYKQMLYNPLIEYGAVLDYMVKHVPAKLYKYSAFNNYFHTNLYDGLIYMGSPTDFNDPFDSAPHMDVRQFWDKKARPFVNTSYNIDVDMEKECSPEYIEKIKDKIILYTHEQMRVTCFSENDLSLLMWAHYGNKHKGYCIEYDTTLMPYDVKRFLLPVIYQDEIYDSTDDMSYETPNYFNFLLHKGAEWSYENEWRIAIYKKALDGNLFFKNYISSVTIGVNCEHNNWIDVRNWARDHKKPVYQTEVAYDKYALTKKPKLSF